MKPLSTFFNSAVLATVIAGVSVAAQTRENATGKPLTVAGCINRAVHDGSLAGSPGVPPASGSNAPQLANSNAPTNKFLLNGATPPDANTQNDAAATAAAKTFSYVLDGAQADFEKHLGHHVEVTGTLTVVREGAEPEIKNEVHHLRVTAIKMLAASCPSSSTS